MWQDIRILGKSWSRVGLHNALDSGVPLFLWFPEVCRSRWWCYQKAGMTLASICLLKILPWIAQLTLPTFECP